MVDILSLAAASEPIPSAEGFGPGDGEQVIIHDIRLAPTEAGRDFGPCLLDLGARWKLGYWNGEGWFGLDGLPATPQRYALLPRLQPARCARCSIS